MRCSLTLHPIRFVQHGASSAEFTLAALFILIIGFSIYELSRAHALRLLFHQAMQESARTAATHHLDPDKMAHSLNQALLPWWARAQPDASKQAQQRTYSDFRSRYQLHPWQVKIVSPSVESFNQHSDRRAQRERNTPYATINNNYQYEHHQGILRAERTGFTPSLPAFSNRISILDANTITLHGVYLYEPVTPLVRQLISLANRYADNTSYVGAALSNGLVPLHISLSMGAQSHPVKWPIAKQSPLQRALSPNDLELLNHFSGSP
ncbi:MAG TPA: TadE family protein [Paenalcaligenes sp.]|nr:TadE family protein [Paenalcaligenes sp.]